MQSLPRHVNVAGTSGVLLVLIATHSLVKHASLLALDPWLGHPLRLGLDAPAVGWAALAAQNHLYPSAVAFHALMIVGAVMLFIMGAALLGNLAHHSIVQRLALWWMVLNPLAVCLWIVCILLVLDIQFRLGHLVGPSTSSVGTDLVSGLIGLAIAAVWYLWLPTDVVLNFDKILPGRGGTNQALCADPA